MVKEAIRNEFIQIFQSGLCFDQNNKVIARHIFQPALFGTQSRQNRIDIGNLTRMVLDFEFVEQLDPDAAEHSGIFTCAVMLKRADLQFFRQHIEFKTIQMGQHNARQFQGINIGKCAVDRQALTGFFEKRQVKPGIVCHQHTVTCKRKKLFQRFGQIGSIGNRFIRNTG